MKQMGLVAVVMFGVAACGAAARDDGTSDAGQSDDGSGHYSGTSGGNSSTSYASGSRLKALTTTTKTTSADGASITLTQFGGWFDSQRDEPCSPATAADGVTRCEPQIDAYYSGFYYADSACTVPAIEASSCIAPKYAADASEPAACTGGGYALHQVGASVDEYWYSTGTDCTGPNAASGVLYYALGAEIPASSFAEMTVTTATE